MAGPPITSWLLGTSTKGQNGDNCEESEVAGEKNQRRFG
jgi:hypothetical protein